MGATVSHHINQTALHALLTSPAGGVARDLLRRGHRVATRAKLNFATSPKRINTGYLRSSIQVRLVKVGANIGVDVYTNVKYARLVHDGTGIYGPRHRMIRPVQAKVLRWTKNGKPVFARQVRGMAPNPFLKNALVAAKG